VARFQRGPQGDVASVKSTAFRKDSPPWPFSTYLASADQRSYDYQHVVHYRGSSETFKVEGRADGDVLVLDADRRGIPRVAVQTEVVGKTVDQPYGYQAVFVDKSNQRLEDPPQTSRSRQLVLTGSPDRHTYRYQVTLFKEDGSQVSLPAKEESKEVPVLVPPVS